MDLIFDVSGLSDESREFTDSKRDVLKYLKIIGVDTRFISYTPDKIYINNLRFSKFSKKRREMFNRKYPDIEVIRSSLFYKIASKASRSLAGIKPNARILMPEDNFLIELILEPYTRKYGVELLYSGSYDLKVNPTILDCEVNRIFSGIFKGIGIDFNKKDNEICPLINVSLEWINSFLKMNNKKTVSCTNKDAVASSFMEFLEDVAPQYRENVLKATEYIKKNLEVEK